MRTPILMTVIVSLITLTSAALGLYVWLFAYAMLRDPTWRHLITLLFLWQTQTGAAFALAAALIGAGVILHQTQANRRQEEEQRERRATALRAVLPLTLSELSDYAAVCASRLAQLLELGRAGPEQPRGLLRESSEAAFRDRARSLKLPSIPTGLVGQLTELIEATKPAHIKPFVILIRRLQIQHARGRNIQKQANDKDGLLPLTIDLRTNLVGGVIDAAEVFVRCSELFPYARGETSAPPTAITSAQVKKALFFLMPGVLADVREIEQAIDAREKSKSGENGGVPLPTSSGPSGD
jgi:hypothetical protein